MVKKSLNLIENQNKGVSIMKIKRVEQETTINYDPIEKVWTVYTCVPSHIKKILENSLLEKENLRVLTVYEGRPTSIEVIVEDSLFNSTFFKQKRVLSTSHKKALLDGRNKVA